VFGFFGGSRGRKEKKRGQRRRGGGNSKTMEDKRPHQSAASRAAKTIREMTKIAQAKERIPE